MASNVRIIRLPCTGRIDPLFIIKAFERGADGVIVSGCHPADCHYTAGNYHARRKFAVAREIFDFMGIDPRRLTFLLGLGFGRREVGRGGQQHDGPCPGARALHRVSRDDCEVGMKALQELAKKLLEEKTVQVVIGWDQGPHGVRPAFITKPEQAERLIFDTRCVHNLATYLSPRRNHLVTLGKKAIVVKGCDARAVAGLIRETQVKREDVVIIGVRCGGVVGDPMGDGKLTEKSPIGSLLGLRLQGAQAGRPPGRGATSRARTPQHGRARQVRGDEPRGALGVLAEGAVALHSVPRVPRGVPDVLLRSVRSRQVSARMDRELAASPREPGLADDAGASHGGAMRGLRRVHARLPGPISPSVLFSRRLPTRSKSASATA